MSDVHVLTGDIFESGAQTLVNTVNTEGVMGKGIALQFKQRYPDMYEDYLDRCKRGEVRLGRPYIYKERLYPWIINFPTKKHWRSISRVEGIVAGLEYLEARYRDWGVTSLAVPPLGCGEGGLEWRVVGRVLYRHLSQLDIPVALYAPFGTPHEQLTESFLTSEREAPFDRGPVRLPPAWIALVEIVHRLEQEPYRWPVGRMMFQKIAYFATEAGLPTNLEFSKSSYGPFASGLKRMRAGLLNNGLLSEEKAPRGNMYVVEPGPTYAEGVEAYRDELNEWSEIINHVTDLFMRFNTRQAEIAGTVHFAATRLVTAPKGKRPTEIQVFRAVMNWKVRRDPPFKDEDVARMIRNLNAYGWIDLEPSGELPLAEDVYVDEFEPQEA
ncbi:MAG: type II toxin-antitoxin system antitoxin DNA ADP-ribosyl glycohydrolase DarG [Pseudonocardiaceae bacterium]